MARDSRSSAARPMPPKRGRAWVRRAPCSRSGSISAARFPWSVPGMRPGVSNVFSLRKTSIATIFFTALWRRRGSIRRSPARRNCSPCASRAPSMWSDCSLWNFSCGATARSWSTNLRRARTTQAISLSMRAPPASSSSNCGRSAAFRSVPPGCSRRLSWSICWVMRGRTASRIGPRCCPIPT